MKQFVTVRFNVRCKWEGFAPQYRIFLNDELFTERTFKWGEDTYIKEMLQVSAEPGIYEFRLEKLEPSISEFTISDPYVQLGNANMIGNNKFEIIK